MMSDDTMSSCGWVLLAVWLRLYRYCEQLNRADELQDGHADEAPELFTDSEKIKISALFSQDPGLDCVRIPRSEFWYIAICVVKSWAASCQRHLVLALLDARLVLTRYRKARK